MRLNATEKPVISQFAFPPTLTEGNSYMVTCNVLTGDAPIAFRWYKDNQTLDNFVLDVQRNEVPDMGSSLVFRTVGQKHAGNYTCVASNKVGEDKHTAAMVVKGESRNMQLMLAACFLSLFSK